MWSSARRALRAVSTEATRREVGRIPIPIHPVELPDVQAEAPAIALTLDEAGISDLRYPITVHLADGSHQPTVAAVSFAASVPADTRGVHMSRFVEACTSGGTASVSPRSCPCSKNFASDWMHTRSLPGSTSRCSWNGRARSVAAVPWLRTTARLRVNSVPAKRVATSQR